MATIDYFSEANQSSGANMLSGGRTREGQIVLGDGSYIGSCKFYLKKTGSPTGNAVARLYAITGTPGTDALPTGSVLATSGNVDVSTFGTDYGLITFTFSGAEQYQTTDGTYYALEIYWSGGDGSNFITVGLGSSDAGRNSYYYDSSLHYDTAKELCFYLYTNSTAYTMEVSVGQFSLTGNNIVTKTDLTINPTVAEFSLTGQNVSMEKGYNMQVSVGEFLLTGKNIIMTTGLNLITSVGEFTTTGIDIIFQSATNLITSVGEFILTGKDILINGRGDWTWSYFTKHTSSYSQPEKHNTSWEYKERN